MRPTPHSRILLTAAGVGFAIGLVSTVAASGAWPTGLPSVAELAPVPQLDPMRALPRTALALTMEEARLHLRADRPWTAWTLLRDYVDDANEPAGPAAVVMAARAAAGWGGWHHVRTLLRRQDWRTDGGAAEAWLLLGRAEQEGGDWQRAADAYRAYAERVSGEQRGIARLRLAEALARLGEQHAAAEALGDAAADLPELADWARALQVERLASAGDPAAVTLAARAPRGSAASRLRLAKAETHALLAVHDTARALDRRAAHVRGLIAGGALAEAAALSLEQAALLQARGASADARELLRSVALEAAAPNETRVAAAARLGEIATERTAAEELARAAAYEAARRPGLAARALRAALAAGAADDGTLRLRLGKLLFQAVDLQPARAVLLDAAVRLTLPEQKAEAELFAARARYRAGERSAALAELQRVVERYPASAAAGSALFLLGDASPRLQTAIAYYARAAEIEHSPDAAEALFRLGDRHLRDRDPAAAARAWRRYVARYPAGERTAEVAYRAGEIYRRRGRTDDARPLYEAALAADPVSYHAVRAAERLDADPLAAVLRDPKPWVGLASDPPQARAMLARLDVLREAGLDSLWREELAASVRRLDARPTALLTLAEGLRDRGLAVDGIRLGLQLAARRGEWDARLLRLVFPLPYRGLILQEARRAGVDPMLLAALVRQESNFRTDARSRVGARGLAQIMPATGEWLGRRMDGYHERLLSVPEVNLRMGARYLGDLLDRYDGATDLALAGYNAGPARADRWRRELGYGRDVDGFRERIPFAETRHYVKVVLRNAALYRSLYGADAE